MKCFGIDLAQLSESVRCAYTRAMLKCSKGQAATEYMVITAVILAASGVVFFYALNYSNDTISTSKALESAETVASAIDYVYASGYGTQTIVDIELPGNLVSSRVGNREVVFVMRREKGTTDIVASTTANATGTLPRTSGMHYILVNYTNIGVVVS